MRNKIFSKLALSHYKPHIYLNGHAEYAHIVGFFMEITVFKEKKRELKSDKKLMLKYKTNHF